MKSKAEKNKTSGTVQELCNMSRCLCKYYILFFEIFFPDEEQDKKSTDSLDTGEKY